MSGKEAIILPYAFSTESMGTTFGVGGGVKGFGQEQLWLGATAFTSVDGANSLMVGMWDLRMPGFDRLYISMIGSSGYYPRQRAYAEYPGTFSDIRAGSNDSDPENYVEDSGHKNWFEVSLEYVLPMGAADKNPMVTYHLKDGILVSKPSGGKKWNPLESGVTVLVAQQRNMYQSYETEQGEIDGVIHPVDFGLLYDNTDYGPNPSFGSRQYIGSTHGIEWGNATEEWRFFEFEANKYFSFSESATARQRVLALNIWTGYSPTWDEEVDPDGNLTIKKKLHFLKVQLWVDFIVCEATHLIASMIKP